jgi:hypothetical protein
LVFFEKKRLEKRLEKEIKKKDPCRAQKTFLNELLKNISFSTVFPFFWALHGSFFLISFSKRIYSLS